MVVSCVAANSEEKALVFIKEQTKNHIVKDKKVAKCSVKLTFEVRLKDGVSTFINKLIDINDVNNATLISYTADFYL